MDFEKTIDRLKLQHKISVREAIDLQNMHTVETEALRKINMRKEDIQNGHFLSTSRSPKEEIKDLEAKAAPHKARIKELMNIIRDAKRRTVPNYY
ncbi:MAG: hypothetical protein KGH54_02550 [Candidatus Micrarchaeota archaeon]|nr:hypothetical protein [Candidatus Micrarchaeota archaeon]